jgi:phenylpyruvate tautomerase PptA (4-oxalocrotonate tautomerase family)
VVQDGGEELSAPTAPLGLYKDESRVMQDPKVPDNAMAGESIWISILPVYLILLNGSDLLGWIQFVYTSTTYAIREGNAMPMIDIYAAAGTFADAKQLAIDAATTVKTIEGVPDIPMFRKNTAAFVHDLPAGTLANVNGDENYVRVQVLTNEGALDRNKQLAVVEQLTKLVSTAAGDESLQERTWVLLTEAKEGGWGLWGHAHTNEELVTAARNVIAKLRAEK